MSYMDRFETAIDSGYMDRFDTAIYPGYMDIFDTATYTGYMDRFDTAIYPGYMDGGGGGVICSRHTDEVCAGACADLHTLLFLS